MAITHSQANPKLIRSGNPLQSFFPKLSDNNYKLLSKKRISTTIPIAKSLETKTITSYKYTFHLHHNKPIREQ